MARSAKDLGETQGAVAALRRLTAVSRSGEGVFPCSFPPLIYLVVSLDRRLTHRRRRRWCWWAWWRVTMWCIVHFRQRWPWHRDLVILLRVHCAGLIHVCQLLATRDTSLFLEQLLHSLVSNHLTTAIRNALCSFRMQGSGCLCWWRYVNRLLICLHDSR
jgi:hypothetical protein